MATILQHSAFKSSSSASFSSSSGGGGGGSSFRMSSSGGGGGAGFGGGASMGGAAGLGGRASFGGGGARSSSSSASFSMSSRSGGGGGFRAGGGGGARMVGARGGGGGGARFGGVSMTTEQAAQMLTSLGEVRVDRTGNKDELAGLNDRFASFINQVRYLENMNRKLTAQLQMVQKQAGVGGPDIGKMWEAELNNIKRLTEVVINEKNVLQSESDGLKAEVTSIKASYDTEHTTVETLRAEVEKLRPDMDSVSVERVDLEARLDTIKAEIDFLKEVYAAELEALQGQVLGGDGGGVFELEAMAAPEIDFESILQDVRMQYESLALQSKQEAQSWYDTKFQTLQQQSGSASGGLDAARAELSKYGSQMKQIQAQIDAAKSRNARFEEQLAAVEAKGVAQLEAKQTEISALEAELQELRGQISMQMAEYTQLMNVKMALDVEIAAYRKLLEGEESRLGAGLSLGGGGGGGGAGGSMMLGGGGGGGMGGGFAGGSAGFAGGSASFAGGSSSFSSSSSTFKASGGGMSMSMSSGTF